MKTRPPGPVDGVAKTEETRLDARLAFEPWRVTAESLDGRPWPEPESNTHRYDGKRIAHVEVKGRRKLTRRERKAGRRSA
jgi:hypothetical protein